MWYTYKGEVLIVTVYVQPGAKRTEISGLHADALKIRLASPPIDGRANDALLKYMAQLFDVPTRQVCLKRGDKSRHKTLEIIGTKITPSALFSNSEI